jgi:hypothetical protein
MAIPERQSINLCLAVTLVFFAATHDVTAIAAEPPNRPPTQSSPPSQSIYKKPALPFVGVPSSRIGGASRGDANDLLVAVFAPDHIGLTSRDQPKLYWYLSKPVMTRIDITLTDDASAQPLLETTVEASSEGGIQSIDLSRYGVRLRPGVPYNWSVAVVNNPDQRSMDIVASGLILFRELPPDVQNRLAQASDREKSAVYGHAGYWYDMVQALEELRVKESGDRNWQEAWANVMKEHGLPIR